MIGRTNINGGGGELVSDAAIIHVNAPIGSTIIFSKNNVIIKKLKPRESFVNNTDNTTADYFYSIKSNNYGTLTITATYEEKNTTTDVFITENKTYDIILSYTLYLCQNGIWNTDIAGTLTTKGVKVENNNAGGNAATPSITYNTGNIYIAETSGYNAGIAYGTIKINLTNRNTLYIRCNGVDTRSSSDVKVCLNIWTDIPTNAWSNNRIATTLIKGNDTFSIDVSSLSDEYYIGVALVCNNGTTSSITLYDLYVL